MKLGYFTMPIHPPGRNYLETLKEDREAFLLADTLGFVEAYMGEHTTDICENVPSCLAFIASLAYATKQIKLGSGTVNLPNSHPAAVAANVAMIDHMLEGRFVFGIGPGGLRSDQEAFGNINNDRTKMFVESIDQILAIWAGQHPYDLKGEFWNITTRETMIPEVGQGVMLKPFQKPYPPIIVTVVEPYSKGVVAAAKRGWKPISANFLQPNWVATHYTGYEQGCVEAGLPASRADWRICKSIFVADDDATAKRYAKSRDGAYGYYYHNLLSKRLARGGAHIYKPDRNMPDSALSVEFLLDTLVIAGGVSSVVEQILKFREAVGDFGTLLYVGHDWVEPALAKRSMELMAEKVMPAVNAAIQGH